VHNSNLAADRKWTRFSDDADAYFRSACVVFVHVGVLMSCARVVCTCPRACNPFTNLFSKMISSYRNTLAAVSIVKGTQPKLKMYVLLVAKG
jgi:hypothetical protein